MSDGELHYIFVRIDGLSHIYSHCRLQGFAVGVN